MKKEKLKVGAIGLGNRGTSILKYTLIPFYEEGMIEISAICDNYEDRVERGLKELEEKGVPKPFATTDYREVLKLDLDAVVIITSWETHVGIAIEAMKAGIYPGIEAGGAYNVEECWELVETSEKTGIPCMLLENCCYGRRELMAFEMVKRGLFGEIVYCQGGYLHDLRYEVSHGEENRHYRLKNYIHRNCENYPTHEIGPIAKILGINDGNRMLYLTSMSSKARGLHDYIVDRKGKDDKYADTVFNQGDIISTTIKCSGGELIHITLDTTLPRAYSRDFTIRGTKGGYFEETDSVFLDHTHDEFELDRRKIWENAEEYAEEYKHTVWKKYFPKGGHDGMDELVYRAFFESAKNGTNPPIDVYDAAAWMSITALTEKSIALGGAPVEIPDFTKGKWMNRTDIADGDFSLKIK